VDLLFKALADPTRRKILDELAERNGQTLFELCQRLLRQHRIGSTRQAISQHLNLLEAANLVTVKREGRYKLHYLNASPLGSIHERWVVKIDKNKENS
jgi:DNA-binding transcriptional ArsR family regulator